MDAGTEITIIAIGNELVQGKVVDKNSAHLAQQLSRSGYTVREVILVPDQKERIVGALRAAAKSGSPGRRAVFTSGGLGPTSDDLTREAVADAAGLQLAISPPAEAKLQELLAARKRQMNENNRRQIYFPAGAEILTNPIGTADAFVTEVPAGDGSTVPVISMPGVPREFIKLVEEQVLPWMRKRFGASEPVLERTFRLFGLSESHVGSLIESVGLPDSISVAYRPQFPEILLTLSTQPGRAESCNELERAASQVSEKIGGQFLFTTDPSQGMEKVVAAMLLEQSKTVAFAESCSAGLLSHRLVSIPGASAFFNGAVIPYANEAKQVLTGVREELLRRVGAVSREIAEQMSYGVRTRLGADIGVSITGIAGPDGGSEEKPVGTFWVGISTPASTEAFDYFYPSERNQFRLYCTTVALDLVRRHLLGLPKRWEIR